MHFSDNLFNSRHDKIETEYSQTLKDHILLISEELSLFTTRDELILVRDRIGFCLEELLFWIERNNSEKYEYSLKSLLSWLLEKYEEGF
tara:strand:+ start:4710 stop:4976 length:267 start_codon:yes stop_codon:yes gene_type:complete